MVMRALFSDVADEVRRLGGAHGLCPEAGLPGKPEMVRASFGVPRVARRALQPTRELGNRKLCRVSDEDVHVVGRVARSEEHAADLPSNSLEGGGKPGVGGLGDDVVAMVGGPHEMDDEGRGRVTLPNLRSRMHWRAHRRDRRVVASKPAATAACLGILKKR